MQSILSRRARQINTFDPVNRSHPLNQGCVGWWMTLPHSEGGGTWYDLMGANHASFVGMNNTNSGWRSTTRPGGYGHVLFDGAALVQCRSGPILAGKPDWAIGAWILNGLPGFAGGRVIYSEGAGGTDIFKFNINENSGNPGFTMTLRNDAGNLAYFFGPTAIIDGAWHRGLAVYSGSTVNIYHNGRLDVTGNWSGPNNFTGPINSRIGGEVGGSFNGPIDGVKLWTGNLLAISNQAAFAAFDYDQSRRGDPDTLNYL